MEPSHSRSQDKVKDIQTLLSNQELLAQISTNLLNAERTFGIFSPQYAAVLNTFFEFLSEVGMGMEGMEGIWGAIGGDGDGAGASSEALGTSNASADEVLSRAMGRLGLGGEGRRRSAGS